MSFISTRYLVFLGILFLVYYTVGTGSRRFQWLILLVSSYVFYGFYSVKYMGFLLFSTLVTWGAALGIDRCSRLEKAETEDPLLTREQKKSILAVYEKKRKRWILLAVVLNIGMLAVMKCANVGLGALSTLLGFKADRLAGIILPMGFSFYTFQSLGYCIDVYRGSVEAQRDLLKYALFVSFFPQICEGPIGNYAELSPQLLEPHAFDYDAFAKGLIRILIGVFKKVVVADWLARFVDPVYASYADFSGAVVLFATFLYALQLYADFSGYIDIALGTGECLGIHLMENFSTPYFSHSITEFWRRWHISLGVWFRNYLYYPVLRSDAVGKIGKRIKKSGKKKLAASVTATIGLAVTWTVIGLWHGVGAKYVAYGWYHGFFIILAVWLSDSYKKAKEVLHIRENKGWELFQIVRTFFLVMIGYVLFRADGFRTALELYRRIVTAFCYEGALTGFYLLSTGESIIVLFGIAAIFLLDLAGRKTTAAEWIYSRRTVLRWPILYALLLITILFFADRPADAGNFIYFKF